MTELMTAYVSMSAVITVLGLIWTVTGGLNARFAPAEYSVREIKWGLSAMFLGWAWPVVLVGVVLAGLGYAIKAVKDGV